MSVNIDDRDLLDELADLLADLPDESADIAGETMENYIKDSTFPAQGTEGSPWKKLRDLTVKLKGHGQILEETGGLKESITHERSGPGEVAVGWPGFFAWLGRIHENGKLILITPRMRRFLMAAMSSVGIRTPTTVTGHPASGTHVWIPARPMLGPSFDEAVAGSPSLLEEVIIVEINKSLNEIIERI